ncbi:sigma-70 family RNA polymerase sigma factor [Sorangium sp. So ce296]|uniref:RNA polymerase sigma factor n=1 Tax=Sorangium sp. So ce296 TaxID=3133296 RepID=UPI003F62EE94
MDPDKLTGAAQAVREALAAQRGALLESVRRRARAGVDAEEVLQRALERALVRSDQVRDPARAAAWVGRVVRNVLLDELRRKHDVALPVDELELSSVEEDSVDCGCVLFQADRLKPEYALILKRVIVDGVAVTEVAAELGVTPGNAMVRLHRARKALRDRLEEHCGTTSARSCSECGCDERGCCPQAP